jgi:hypothetical protein
MSSKVQEKKISSLIQDDKNLNKHNQYGMHLLEKSISTLGLGRSILVDKNNRIIGGNGVTETAASLGLEDCIIVETTGNQLVVVKRTDVDLDSKMGRELALADNAVAHVNLDWDQQAVQELSAQWEIKPEDWGVKSVGENNPEDEWNGMPEYEGEDKSGVKDLIIHFKSIEDYINFGKLIDQKLSEKTKSIWFPEEKAGSQTDHVYEAEKG